jgi:protein-S-isoprenylcysteine O-methyltransferase Ste14
MLMASGVSLLFRSWVGLALCLPVLWVLIDRIRDEEAVLQQEFGPAWRNYTQRSWRLLPYLY